MEPPEAQSIRSMLHIVRILLIIVAVLLFLGGIAYVALVWAAYNSCSSVIGGTGGLCGAGLGFALVWPIVIVIFGLIDFFIYVQMKAIEALVNQRQYEAAKQKTLVWMVIGFILGGILPGILLLIAYIKFDPLITWQRNQGAGGMPPPPTMTPPMTSAPAMGDRFCPACGAPNPRTSGFCAKCGKPLPPA